MRNRAIYFERDYVSDYCSYEYRFFGIPEDDVKYGGLMTTYIIPDDVDLGYACSFGYTALDVVDDLLDSCRNAKIEGMLDYPEYISELQALRKYLKDVEYDQMRLRALDRVDEIDDEIERLNKAKQNILDVFLGN